ncbi:hypothetical protein BJ970_002724 [Saccharopolyspora phatthalungensis]|uniref:Uncharacterized protein n=1 Tax=Saccharopolyspora phatthalungensis TaxID=664693 RepID=A0A840Q5N5_9PSEU|nr:hypothetical protein [Saccharopolyspora phatthalungensis]MBB5155190.1 hypothetical protein [Saccharopolyspora phatthalungensis]
MSDWMLETPAETGWSRMPAHGRTGWTDEPEGEAMGKRARKKKDRRKNKANHGKRPNGS